MFFFFELRSFRTVTLNFFPLLFWNFLGFPPSVVTHDVMDFFTLKLPADVFYSSLVSALPPPFLQLNCAVKKFGLRHAQGGFIPGWSFQTIDFVQRWAEFYLVHSRRRVPRSGLPPTPSFPSSLFVGWGGLALDTADCDVTS